MFSFKPIGPKVATNLSAESDDNKYIYIKNDRNADAITFDNEYEVICSACNENFKTNEELKKHKDKCKLYKEAEKIANERIKILSEQDKVYDSLSDNDKWDVKTFTNAFLYPTMFVNYNISNDPNRIFIVGASGSRKSTWVNNYIKANIPLTMNKYLISSQEHELKTGPYKDLNIKQIKLNKNIQLIPSSVLCNKLRDSIIVFDDIENIDFKKFEIIPRLISDILICGRKMNIHMIEICHIAHSKTKSFTESNGIVLFLNGLSQNLIERILYNYLGFNRSQINKILTLENRWLYIHKDYPQYILSNDFIASLKHF